jgi:hypothetical protein
LVPKNHSTEYINQEESTMATAAKSGDKPPKPKTAAKPAAKTAAKAPAAKPAASKPAPAKSAAAAKPARTTAKKPAAPALSPEQRRYYVEVAAYYIAERRGFHGGGELDDWVTAEAEIDRLLREGVLKP